MVVWILLPKENSYYIVILSLFILTCGGRSVKAINMGHTVIQDDLYGDIPSVLNIIPCSIPSKQVAL